MILAQFWHNKPPIRAFWHSLAQLFYMNLHKVTQNYTYKKRPSNVGKPLFAAVMRLFCMERDTRLELVSIDATTLNITSLAQVRHNKPPDDPLHRYYTESLNDCQRFMT